MSTQSDQNKALAVRMWQEVLNGKNFNVIREINSPDYRFNGQPQSYEEVVGFINWMSAQAPGFNFLILNSVAEGDTVSLLWKVVCPGGGPVGKGSAIGANFLSFAGGQIIANDQAGGLPDFVKDPD